MTTVTDDREIYIVALEVPSTKVVTVGQTGPAGAAGVAGAAGATGATGATGPPGTGLTGLADKAVLFGNSSGSVAQDASNFVWDDTNNRLGLGTATPNEQLELTGNLRLATTGVVKFGADPFIRIPGTSNTFIGVNAGNNTLTGIRNICIGPGANPPGFSLTSGLGNIIIGYSSGAQVSSGSGNIVLGHVAGASIGSGGSNIVLGSSAGPSLSSGGSNILLGAVAGSSLSSGSNNIYIGESTTGSSGGSSNVAIGYSAQAAGDNRIAIGSFSTCNVDNQAVLGNNVTTAWRPNTDGVTTLGTGARGWLGIFFDHTTTAVGTTGNRTINKPAGRVNIAAAGTTVTVTNSLVTADSLVQAWCMTNDGTAYVKNVVPAAGSFVVNLGAAATAEVAIGFLVINTD